MGYADVVASPTTHRFTVKDYHRMAEFKIFDPKDRVELVDGVVFDMSPIGARHGSCVDRLAHSFFGAVQGRGIVRVQGAVQVGEFSEPQPDVAILRFRADFYENHHPMPPDILLVVEVADTSLRHDVALKAPLYIAGGVPEVWVVDLVTDTVHVTRGNQSTELHAGDSVSPLAVPDLQLEVAAILGGRSEP
jgi:Uma2 family endonuclease